MASSTRPFAEVSLSVERRSDGSIVLRNPSLLNQYPATLIESLRHWSIARGNSDFLVENSPRGASRRTYGEMWSRTAFIGTRILAAACSSERPVAILASNGVEHAEVALAAMRVGVPAVPLSIAYATHSSDGSRLRHVVESATPAILYVPAGDLFRGAIEAVRHLVDRVIEGPDWSHLPTASDSDFAQAEASVRPSTIAKLLFSSGSTDIPKAIPNTHQMLCVNQAALSHVWPCIADAPPVLVDWLPWNHTFGGNFTFNMVLTHGGTLHIDDGKPTAPLIGRTVENLRATAPTAYFNVPAGYEALLPYLEADASFSRHFFSRARFLFSAAAALPQQLRDRLDEVSLKACGRVLPVIGGWGSTETSPCCTAVYFETPSASNLGLPLPEVVVKLSPCDGKMELRVKGPNVMAGYWRQPSANANAFDEEGYYRMGDAGRLIDDDRPELGIAFDGRIVENFKLRSGTWIHVGALRLAVIDACRPLINDCVITGHGGDELGVLIFPNFPACRALIGGEVSNDAVAEHPAVLARLRRCLNEHNRASPGSSTHVACFSVQPVPPRPDLHEITDKGYINQRAVLNQRADSIRSMHASPSHRVREE